MNRSDLYNPYYEVNENLAKIFYLMPIFFRTRHHFAFNNYSLAVW